MSNKVTQVQIRGRTFNNKYSAVQGTVCLKTNVVECLDHKKYKIIDALDDFLYPAILVKGRAVCSSGDKFDPELGMQIAANRARIKGNGRLLKRIRAARKQLQEFDELLSSMEEEIHREQTDRLILELSIK